MRIIIIISDTFRYDNLQKPETITPNLYEFAKTATFFENCYISSFPTIPHRKDIMTGRYSFPYHDWKPLANDEITLAQILSQNNYLTQLIADTPHLLKRGYNYDRGFIGYYWERGQESDIPFTRYNHQITSVMPAGKTRVDLKPFYQNRTLLDLHKWVNWWWSKEEDRFAPRTAKNAIRWFEDNYNCENFLLWLDFFDPHEPWDPPEYLVKLYDPDYKDIPMTHPNYGPADVYCPAELKNLVAHYRAEVTLVDKWIGKVIEKTKELGIYNESLIIFTSDHGMYLGEHNRTGKSNICKSDTRGPWPLYEEITRIPLIIHLPGQKARNSYTEIVQPPDVLPTILDILKIRGKPKMHGHSLELEPIFKNKKWSRNYAFSSSALKGNAENDLPWTTVSNTEWTFLIGGKKDDQPQLYNLREDALQERNILEKNKAKAREMMEAFIKFLESLDTGDKKIEAIKRRFPFFEK